jgi:hypothetical protein
MGGEDGNLDPAHPCISYRSSEMDTLGHADDEQAGHFRAAMIVSTTAANRSRMV